MHVSIRADSSSGPVRRTVQRLCLAVALAWSLHGCGIQAGAGGGIPYFPADVSFAHWDSLGPGQCRGSVFNRAFVANNIRIRLWYATPTGEVSQTVAVPGLLGPFQVVSFVAAPQLTAGLPRYPRVGEVTFTNEQGNYGGSSPAQPRTPALSFSTVWCRLDADSVDCEIRNEGGYAYDVVIHLETRDGPRDVALTKNPLPYGVATRFRTVRGDSAGIAMPPRVLSVHWEDYGGAPGDQVSPPTANRIYGCEAPANVLQWGSPGSGDGQFEFPTGVAVGSGGNIYVTDTQNHRVQVFSAGGLYLSQWGTEGSGAGQFLYPNGIAVGPGGNVYVADRGNARVEVFTSTGTFITQWGTRGSGNGQFYAPTGVAVGSGGAVYVADASSDRIQMFTSAGDYVTQWSGFNPADVAVDAGGRVYVADERGNRLHVFTATGTLITRWFVNRASGVAVDARGIVYASTGNYDVRAFTSDGLDIAEWGSYGTGDGQFRDAAGVAVDAAGYVYVVDSANDRVQKFESLAVYMAILRSRASLYLR